MAEPTEQQATAGRHPLPALFRPRDLPMLGLSRARLRSMLRRGQVDRVTRGLYRVRQAAATELETIITVAARAPDAVVCLLSALHLHGIGTQLPRQVWIAVDRKKRVPRLGGLPIRVVRYSGRMLSYAVETRQVQGVNVCVTSPARTVVDCLRYRGKVGLDVALEALRDALRSRKATVDEILRTAEVCRIASVMRPYLESMLS